MIAVIGAGVAGLTAAKVLQESGLECQVFDASDAIGGRVRSDRVGGFVLDNDHTATSSIEAAMKSGERAAKQVKFRPG